MTYKDTVFLVGDHIYLLKPPYTEVDYEHVYTIVSLKEERGGNFHDGHTLTTFATLFNIVTKETKRDILLRYDNYMCRYAKDYAVVYKVSPEYPSSAEEATQKVSRQTLRSSLVPTLPL